MTSTTSQGPGRLGDVNMTLAQEPRAHPKLVETMRAFGLVGNPSPYDGKSKEQLASTSQMAINHAGIEKLAGMLPTYLPGDEFAPKIERTERTFKSFDGVERTLYVFRPVGLDQVGPAVAYIHGGGMVIRSSTNSLCVRWCTSMAEQGLVVILVDFRNAYTPEAHNMFPTGLNDCASAIQWIHSHKTELGISKIVLQGESGGANLCLATALKAKREGWLDQIAGVHAAAPYISNAYDWDDARKLRELPSLYECDGYLIYASQVTGLSYYYSGDDDAENPLAWPYHASIEDCRGLPPHVLVMDELDPLRDEGMAYHRKLTAAGVEVSALVNLGVVHATALVFRQALPEAHYKTVRDVVSFARSL